MVPGGEKRTVIVIDRPGTTFYETLEKCFTFLLILKARLSLPGFFTGSG